MESFLIAGAFFLMVFTPALVGARSQARDNRLATGELPRRRLRIPSLSASLSNIRSRRRVLAPVAVEDPLAALAMEMPELAEPQMIAEPVPAVAVQTAVYVKNFTFDVSRFNQPQRHHHDVPIQVATVPYEPAEFAMQALAAEPLAEMGPEAGAGDSPVSYGDPEPLYVRRAVYGQRPPRFAAQPQEHAHDEMVAYPYASPFAYPAQGPFMPQHPMAGQIMPPMPPGYPPMPQAAMGMPFPNPYLYPMAFMPMYPMGFYPTPMPGPMHPQGYAGQQPPMGPVGPQLVEPQPGYGAQARWEHRSAAPRRTPFRRA